MERTRQKNVWKSLFFLILTFNVIIILMICILLYLATDESQIEIPDNVESDLNGYALFAIQTDKNDLNNLINHYIEKEGLNGPIDYHVLITEEVELYGEIEMFSTKMQVKMTFEPQALENGDLLLKQSSLSLGGVSLPVTYVLKLIRDAYQVPEWVIIQPEEKQIYVSLREMKLKNNVEIRAEEFNVAENNIKFKMYLPVK